MIYGITGQKFMKKLSITITFFILPMVLTIVFITGCKTSTTPPSADCDTGYLPCDNNITECCEVLCENLYHNCGDLMNECCIDTTSSTFIFQLDTIGLYGSYLNDIVIVDENNIWVVGALSIDDTTLVYPTQINYNAAHWNGNEWEYQLIVNTAPLNGIFYFDEDDFWVISGYPKHWDGEEWTNWLLHNYGIDVHLVDLWGNSSSNMYFVGWEGAIVYYDGSNFIQMESGTSVDLDLIVGSPDGNHVFAVGREPDDYALTNVLEFLNDSWNILFSSDDPQSQTGYVFGIGLLNDTLYLTSSTGLWEYNYITEELINIPDIPVDFETEIVKVIKAEQINDILFIGAGFIYTHFNGHSYLTDRSILNLYTQRASQGGDYKDDMLVMCGFFDSYGHALVARGYRQ